jgi:hypothetical protein
MAMAFTYQLLENGPRNLILAINGVDTATTVAGTQDGTQAGIFNAAGVTVPTVHYKVARVLYSSYNCFTRLQWHATANVDLITLGQNYGDINLGQFSGRYIAGINNNAGAGVTGDIDIFTTPFSSITAASGGITAAVSIILFGIKGTGT